VLLVLIITTFVWAKDENENILEKYMKDNNLTKAMQTRKFLRDNKTRDISKNKIEKTKENCY
jgi:hypothetical protein